MNRAHSTFFVLILLAALPARADDLHTADFALRFSAALTRLSPYPDVAGQAGASAASVRATSTNPAALAWLPLPGTGERRFALSGQYTGISFHQGTDIWAATQSFVFNRLDDATGEARFALKLSASQLRSDESPQRTTGRIFETDVNVYRLDLGWRFAREKHPFSLGLQLNYSQSETNVSQPLPAPAQPRRLTVADADRESFGVRLGGQVSLIPPAPVVLSGDGKSTPVEDSMGPHPYDRWLLGIVADYTFQPTKQMLRNDAGAPNTDRHDFHQVLLRIGTAVRYTSDEDGLKFRAGYVRLDYQWGWWASDREELQVHRLYCGGNLPLWASPAFGTLDLNAGAVVDDRHNVGWSVGFFYRPNPLVAIEAAYQHDMLPEVAVEFGHADVLVLSAGFAF